jgi:ankyrin repeat protein
MLKRFVILTLLLSASVHLIAATHKLTPDEAKKLLAASGDPETADGLLSILQTSREDGPAVIEAYLALGVRADQPITFQTSEGTTASAYPLNFLLRFDCSSAITISNAQLLLDAGADPSLRDEGDNGRTPAIDTVRCPEVLRLILAKKPDLSLVDNQKRTAMYHAVVFGDQRLKVVQMLLDAGFDVRPWRKELLEAARQEPDVRALLEGKKPAVATHPPVSASAVDWKSLPPYPARSAAEARKLLLEPGSAATIQDEFWDGITSREPLRLALALEAGADVRKTRSVTNYTPLVLAAERCSMDREADQQTAVTEQLIAAGADLTGVDANRANALTMAAHGCPVGVVRALIKGGLPLAAVSSIGDTPLRVAIMAGRADVVAALLSAGVDPKKEPYNPRKLAAGNDEIEKLLKGRK